MHKKTHLTPYGKALWAQYKQRGSGWGDFTSWLRGAARTVYDRAIKPAYQFVRDKPLTTAAAAARLIPGSAGTAISGALGTAATLTGKGKRKRKSQKGGAKKNKAISFK